MYINKPLSKLSSILNTKYSVAKLKQETEWTLKNKNKNMRLFVLQ